MSAEQKLKMAAEDVLDEESLEPTPQIPMDIEDLYEAPDPASLEPADPYDELEGDADSDTDVRGFLPPPEAPRGLNEGLPELEQDESGFQALSTDESHVRERMLWTAREADEADRNKVPTRGENALRDWRLKSGNKRREHAERQAAEKRTNRNSLGLGLAIGLAIGLLGLGVVWALGGSEETAAPVEAITTGTPTEATLVPTPEAAAPTTPVAETPVQAGWTPPLVDGTYMSWAAEDHLYWQFDYASEQTLRLRWLDAAGAVALDDTECGRIDGAMGRCYVGRSVERFEWLVRQGAAGGTWTVEACQGADCGVIDTFEVGSGS